MVSTFLQLVGTKQTEFQVNSMQLLYYQVCTNILIVFEGETIFKLAETLNAEK